MHLSVVLEVPVLQTALIKRDCHLRVLRRLHSFIASLEHASLPQLTLLAISRIFAVLMA